MKESLVNAEWLNSHINDSDLIVLDASQIKTATGLVAEFDEIQIINSRSFDIKGKFCETATNLPNMLPSAEQFEDECRKLGINKNSKIVIYDNLGVYFSPRAWWMFKTFGHIKVAVLDGGLPNWVNQGFKTEIKVKKEFDTGNFCASFNPKSVKTFKFISENVIKQESLLIDARPAVRFNGIAPEPRKGLQSGHIKNSINVPFEAVLKNGKFKAKSELKSLFSKIQIQDRPLIFSCGSGITACIVLLAFELVLDNEKSVYDGSWTEWAQNTGRIQRQNA